MATRRPAGVPVCEVQTYTDACPLAGTIVVEYGGQTYNVCPEHRRLLEQEVPPTPTPQDEPVHFVRAELDRWKQARRKHEQQGNLVAAAECARLQSQYHRLLQTLDGPQGSTIAPPAAPTANYPKPWEVRA
jgi:hypothetical protein